MLTVLSVLFDGRDAEHGNIPPFSANRYGPEWADRLYRGIKRHLRQPFRFVCLTDREYDFAERIEQVRLEQPTEGWMAINEAFRPDLGIERGLLMGLDTVIVGSLDDLASFDGPLGVPRDPIHPRMPCNAVVSFNADAADFLWTEWNRDRWHWRRECMFMGHPSEMVFLRKLWPRPDFHYLDDAFPDQLVSYKCHLRPRNLARGDARIVYFHGKPKPCELKADDWVRQEWEAA